MPSMGRSRYQGPAGRETSLAGRVRAGCQHHRPVAARADRRALRFLRTGLTSGGRSPDKGSLGLPPCRVGGPIFVGTTGGTFALPDAYTD